MLSKCWTEEWLERKFLNPVMGLEGSFQIVLHFLATCFLADLYLWPWLGKVDWLSEHPFHCCQKLNEVWFDRNLWNVVMGMKNVFKAGYFLEALQLVWTVFGGKLVLSVKPETYSMSSYICKEY